MLLPQLLADAAERFPEKHAAVFPDERLTFLELDRRANQVASRLRKRGIGPGHRVAMLTDSTPAGLVFFWGVLKAGAEPVDVPGHVSPATIALVLEEARPSAVAIDPRALARSTAEDAAAWRAAMPPLVLSTEAARAHAQGRELNTLEQIQREEGAAGTATAALPGDVALTIYTSGTTGRPKGVMLSHENLISNIAAANSLLGLTSDDSLLIVVPLYFIHGRMQLLTHALLGGTVYFSRGFQFPAQVVQELLEYGVSGFSGVPYHFSTLLERSPLKSTRLPHLRYVLITGGALPLDRLRELSGALPGIELHTAYGMTEASPRVTYLGPREVLRHGESAGRALPGILVEILGEDGQPLPQGAIGEVVVSGPNVMKGYVSGDHLSSGRIDAKGRLHTQDLGRLDADGFLFLHGRKSDMIKTAGERLFPKEIEEVLLEHPAVKECAVIGAPDPVLGERVVAFVVLRPGKELAQEALHRHALRYVPFVRAPREYHFLTALPKTASEKTNRAALVELTQRR